MPTQSLLSSGRSWDLKSGPTIWGFSVWDDYCLVMIEHEDRTPPDGTPRRKAVFFCPECGHESPVNGDWQTNADVAHTYTCPECETVIDNTGPTDDDEESHLPLSAEVSVWLFSFWSDRWTTSFDSRWKANAPGCTSTW